MRHVLPALLLLAGCAQPGAHMPPFVQAFVGAREDQVIGTLGVPNRAYEVGTTSVLGFDIDRIAGDPDAAPRRAVPADAVLVPPCELTFTLREYEFRTRRVESYSYVGPGCR
ncbi:hypothetical protein ACE7GA_03225 [Roseomonas sp. CCTCC AB2023176]|uniref:hypothetical protein n=1 Tax=Roseomonas sp. CCTCC AB2023176 TaxID=3342640 RepID=UPI0035D83031